MSDKFTFRGINITNLLVKYATIKNTRERNEKFLNEFIKVVDKLPTDEELSGLYMIMSGMHFTLNYWPHNDQ